MISYANPSLVFFFVKAWRIGVCGTERRRIHKSTGPTRPQHLRRPAVSHRAVKGNLRQHSQQIKTRLAQPDKGDGVFLANTAARCALAVKPPTCAWAIPAQGRDSGVWGSFRLGCICFNLCRLKLQLSHHYRAAITKAWRCWSFVLTGFFLSRFV